MKRIVTKVCTGLLLATLLTSCASHVKITDTMRDPEAPATVYKKILVVAITYDGNLREMFENILAETLNKHGVAAIASHKLFKDFTRADKALLQSLASQEGADAVLITRGLSKSEHTDYQYFGGNIEARTVVMQKQDEDSSTTIAMSAVGIAPKETDFVSGTLLTRLFDAASAKLLWVAHSKFINDGRKADACWDFSILMTRALADDRLVQLNGREFRKPTL
jgi:hypothetical protein